MKLDLRSRSALLGLVLCMAAGNLPAQTIWHVDGSLPTSGNGQSWASALTSIDKALRAALPGDQVWVREGTYRPAVRTAPLDPRSATFYVPQAVALYGGFAGTETSLDQRAGLFATTVLSGDLGFPGDPSDDAYNVVTVHNPSGIPIGITRVDGFTIERGNADGSGFQLQGGGVLSFNSATVLADCRIRRNRAFQGGGVHAQPGWMRLLRCELTENQAATNGGGLWSHAANILAVHCRFADNVADSNGGGVYLHSTMSAGAVRFVSSLFHDNQATNGGGAFLGGGQFASGKATFLGCTIAQNRASNAGGGIRAVTGVPIPADSRLRNCIVWRNQAPSEGELAGAQQVSFSDVRGGASGTGNIAADPRFVDPGARDFRLRPGSPCIDAGSNALVPADELDVDRDGDLAEQLPLDLDALPRFADDPAVPDSGEGAAPVVDMGAFERRP